MAYLSGHNTQVNVWKLSVRYHYGAGRVFYLQAQTSGRSLTRLELYKHAVYVFETIAMNGLRRVIPRVFLGTSG